MSFLAKLREQNTLPGQGMHLSYVLGVDPFTRIARLHLLLTDPREGLKNSSNVYTIQRQHLERPPSFLNDDDVGILRALVNDDENWLGQSEGQFSARADEVLRDILKTKRCFLREAGRNPIAMRSGDNLPIDLVWRVTADGNQELTWRVPENLSYLFLSGTRLSTPWIYDPVEGQLPRGIHGYSDDALTQARKAPDRLAPNNVEEFIARNDIQW